MGLDGSTQRIVTGLTFFSGRRRSCLCLAGAFVGAGFCGVRAASHLAAGSFLHSSHRYVLSSSSGLMRRLQDLQVLTGLLVIHSDIVVLTGLGLGVEQLAADDICARVLLRLPTRRLPKLRLRITRRGK